MTNNGGTALLGFERKWMEKYNRLVVYQEKYESLQVPSTEDNALHLWIKNQRSMKRAGTLREDREQLLNGIGFVWRPKLADSSWMDKYKRLIAFKEQNGHFQVPMAKDKELRTWLNNQQTYSRKGTLRKDREELLDKIGFVWSVKKNFVEEITVAPNNSFNSNALEPPTANESSRRDTKTVSKRDEELWMSRFRSLCVYKKKHGHTAVPRTGTTHELGRWLSVQQGLIGRGRLSEDKKKKLLGVLTADALAARTPVSLTTKKSVADEAKGDTRSECVASPLAKKSEAPGNRFAIGTRLEKLFKADDGVTRSFGGTVVSFEQFEENDGTRPWGYLIHYDDDDREHMLESDVAKHVINVNSKKRTRKCQEKPKQSKRQKISEGAEVSVQDALSIVSDKELIKAASVEMNTDASKNVNLTTRELSEERKCRPSSQKNIRSQDCVASCPPSQTNRTTQDEGKSRVSPLRNKLAHETETSRPTTRETTRRQKDFRSQAENMNRRDIEVQTKQQGSQNPKMNTIFSDDDVPQHDLLLPRSEINAQPSVGTMNGEEEMGRGVNVDLESAVADSTQALNIQSSVTNIPRQRFPNGTRVSRNFMDLCDNEQEKAYRGESVDFVYLEKERD